MPNAGTYDEEEVLAGCLAGDESAWRTLIIRYENMVYSIARRVAGGAAADAAQETFLRVFRKLHTFRRGAKFSSWLYRVAYNAAVDVAHKRGALADPPDEEDSFPEKAYEGPGPDDLAASAEEAALAREALKAVRPEYRQVLELYYLFGKSYEEVAAVTGLPLGTVKSHIHRGKAAVLNELARRGVVDAAVAREG